MTRKDLLTPAEHEIMLHIWALQDENPKFMVIRQVQEHYSEETRPVYTTLSTFVKILQNKGYLTLSKIGNNINIQPKVTRKDYCKKYMQIMLNDYFKDDSAAMIKFIISNSEMSKSQKEEVKAALA